MEGLLSFLPCPHHGGSPVPLPFPLHEESHVFPSMSPAFYPYDLFPQWRFSNPLYPSPLKGKSPILSALSLPWRAPNLPALCLEGLIPLSCLIHGGSSVSLLPCPVTHRFLIDMHSSLWSSCVCVSATCQVSVPEALFSLSSSV